MNRVMCFYFPAFMGGLTVLAAYFLGKEILNKQMGLFAAFFLGYFVDKYIRSRSFISMLGLMLFANFVIIQGFGLAHLYIWLTFVKGSSVNIVELLVMGMIPFIVGDILKIFTAAGITRAITPKMAYNGELDAGKWKSWRIP